MSKAAWMLKIVLLLLPLGAGMMVIAWFLAGEKEWLSDFSARSYL